jgi:hypothetical protein
LEFFNRIERKADAFYCDFLAANVCNRLRFQPVDATRRMAASGR